MISSKWSMILTRGRIVGRGFVTGEVNVTPASWEQYTRLQQSPGCRYWVLLHTPQQWLAVFLNETDNPQNCPFPFRDLYPIQLVVPWAHLSLLSNRHLDRSSSFCRAHERDQQTDRHTDTQTDHVTQSVVIGRILLLLRAGIIIWYVREIRTR